MALDTKLHAAKQRRKNLHVDFYARILGSIEWVCPQCNRMRFLSVVNHHRPRHTCPGNMCHRVTTFGVLASEVAGENPPYSAIYNPTPRNRRLANCLTSGGKQNENALGQIVGHVEWWCPMNSCHHRNMGKPDAKTGYVVCKNCFQGRYLSLILARPALGGRATTPIDWIPPLWA